MQVHHPLPAIHSCLRGWCFSGFRPSTSCFLKGRDELSDCASLRIPAMFVDRWDSPMVFGKRQVHLPDTRFENITPQNFMILDSRFYPQDPKESIFYLEKKKRKALKVARHQFLQMIEVLATPNRPSTQGSLGRLWSHHVSGCLNSKKWSQRFVIAYPFW